MIVQIQDQTKTDRPVIACSVKIIEYSVHTRRARNQYQHRNRIVDQAHKKKVNDLFHHSRGAAQLTVKSPQKAIKVNTGRVTCCLKD